MSAPTRRGSSKWGVSRYRPGSRSQVLGASWRVFLRRRVDPRRLGQLRRARRVSDEPLGMTGVGREERCLSRREELWGESIVDGVRRHQPDARVPVLMVVVP